MILTIIGMPNAAFFGILLLTLGSIHLYITTRLRNLEKRIIESILNSDPEPNVHQEIKKEAIALKLKIATEKIAENLRIETEKILDTLRLEIKKISDSIKAELEKNSK